MGNEVEEILSMAQQHLDKGEFVRAEALFQMAYNFDDNPVTLNNLALTYFLNGKKQKALEALQPNLALGAFFSPFGHALAAEILVALGRTEEARKEVGEAIRDFEQGLRFFKAQRSVDLRGWQEYTPVIMRVAGKLGDYTLVLELYKRWQTYHLTWHSKYYAGIASFNRGRFTQAASYWSAVNDRFGPEYAMIAMLAERGVVPPFLLEFEPTQPDVSRLKGNMTETELQSIMGSGNVRMMFLRALLSPEGNPDFAVSNATILVKYGGEWGQNLGRNLLEFSGFPDHLKFTVAKALRETGVFGNDEPVPMVIGGERREVQVGKYEIVTKQDPQLEQLYKKALQLRDSGKGKEALVLLEKLFKDGVFYPPAIMGLANLYRDEKRYKEAKMLLDALEEIAPQDPSVLFNLGGLALEMHNFEGAKVYLKKINRKKIDKYFVEKIETLEHYITEAQKNVSFLFAGARRYRKEVEDKLLPAEVQLKHGLKNLPVEWLNYICRQWGLEEKRLRKEREEHLIGFLTSEKAFVKMISLVEKDERELLSYLLERGGQAKNLTVIRKFGSMDNDGFGRYFGRTVSVPGRLWTKGLVFAGTMMVKGKREKMFVVPIELRDTLLKLVSISKK